MKKDIKIGIVILTLLFSSMFTVGINSAKATSGVDAPEWSVGDTWVYDIDVEALYDYDIKLDINIHLRDIVYEVNQVTDTDYLVSIGGRIDASGEYKGFSGGMDKGTISAGRVRVRKSDLAVLGAEDLRCNGKATVLNIPLPIGVSGYASITDLTPINYLKFPFDVGDKWTRSGVNGLLNISVKVGNIINEGYTFNIYQPEDNLEVVGTETINIDGTPFECYKIVGDMGFYNAFWYSPEIGNIVKGEMIDFELFFEEGNDLHYDIAKVDITLTGYGKVSDPPEIPAAPTGPTSGDILQPYTFEASAEDPNGDKVKYIFDWGDETQSETDFVNSGQKASASHNWKSGARFEVRVKAQDINGAESDWSNPSYIDIKGEVGTANLQVYIYRIKELDEIDPWTDAEYSYRLSVYDGNGWITRQHDLGDGNDKRPKKTYDFPIQTGEPKIKIKLWERDPVVKNPLTGAYILGHDLADVSSHLGDGMNNQIPDDRRGAIYHGTYLLNDHSLKTETTAENDEVGTEDGYIITSGRDDGSEADDVDSNDAKIWFRITDDYQPMSNLRIENPNGNNIYYLNQEIQFEADVDDGLAPFTWNWNFGDGTTSRNQNPIKSYDTLRNDYTVKVEVTDITGTTLQSDPIHIQIKENTPPTADQPYGEGTPKQGEPYDYVTRADDAEGHKVEFAWDWNGNGVADEGEWDNAGGDYYPSGQDIFVKHTWTESGKIELKVKARDICGDEGEWSDGLIVTITKSRSRNLHSLIMEFLESNPHIFPILRHLLGLYF